MKKLSEILNQKNLKRDYRCSYEFQAYGNKLADELNDPKHRSLYIKLAKEEDRDLLEKARIHILSSTKAETKGRLFMWKLKELKKEKSEKSVK